MKDRDMEQTLSWFESGAATHVGKVRRQNEDSHLVSAHSGVWAVADGMGGHSAGDLASRIVVEELARIPRGIVGCRTVGQLRGKARRCQ